ncbi:MAG: hypothetical protein RBT82_12445 [Desulfomonilia bacterium]|jgi:hypothetical protein|nr:hypothetical protein [Desulfomonilia bacterium]
MIEPWQHKFKHECLKRPGQHIMIVATTGFGKTNVLQFITEGLVETAKNETIVYFDSGKSSEFLVLGQFAPLNVIVPRTMDIDIDAPGMDIRVRHMDQATEVWDLLVKSRINVVVIEPYADDPGIFVPIIIKMFRTLIKKARAYELPVPLTVEYDEINNIAPGKNNAHGPDHNRLGAVVQYNVEKLRSLKVRIVGSSQGWTSVRKGLRGHFHWTFAKNGAQFTEGRMARYNAIFESLKEDEGILVYPDQKYSDVIRFPYYGEGDDFGTVRYAGELKPRGDPERDEDRISLDDFLGINDDETTATEPAGEGAPEISIPAVLELLDDATRGEVLAYLKEGKTLL